MAYDMRDPFIIPALVDEYAGAVKDFWGERVATGVYLLSHCLKFLIRVVSQFQRDSYKNFNDNENIISCEWMNKSL